jgi:polyferredoxin
MRNIRRIAQILFLLFFVYLLLQTAYPFDTKLSVEMFLRWDPLHALITAISSRTISVIGGFFIFAIALVVLTVFLGRFFCGWVCPLGTTYDIIDKIGFGKRRRPGQLTIGPRRIKYYLLAGLVVLAIAGANIAGWVDPLSLVTRTFVLVLYPMSDFLARVVLRPLASNATTGAVFAPAYDFMLENVLPLKPPVYQFWAAFFIIFAAIIASHFYQKRFWCRNLCPLGGLLGLISKKTFMRVYVKPAVCIDCGRCENICPTGAIIKLGEKDRHVEPLECIQCFTCYKICPVSAVGVTFRPKRKEKRAPRVIPERRRLIFAGLLGLAVLPLLKRGATAKVARTRLIRPPGAQDEEEFLRKCLRCGQCMKICPENAIQPAMAEAGLEGVWTPVLVPTIGYCSYTCADEDKEFNNLCGMVCPSGAIEKLSLKEKHERKIGTAYVDRSKCIPWTEGVNCGVCEEHCPVEGGKAIVHEPVLEHNGATFAEDAPLLLPKVLKERCIGCGICENKCPVEGTKAIRVDRLQIED